MEFKIETGIPVASPVTRPKASQYPFAKMAVGTSFFVPAPGEENTFRHLNNLCCRARTARKNGLGRFVCRTVIENGVKGVRVWRVE